MEAGSLSAMSLGHVTLPSAISEALALTLISQGAEAQIYLSLEHPFIPSAHLAGTISETNTKPGAGYILKYRPPKRYRHSALDAQLTKHRTLSEARILYKLFLAGISVPQFIAVDPRQGLIWMENIDGQSLKEWIWTQETEIEERYDDAGEEGPAQKRVDIIRPLLLAVGNEIAKLHFLETVHGDLTTSNILLRDCSRVRADGVTVSNKEPVIIDFGLAQQSTLPEDKAVDLYVLERAFISTHPIHSEEYVKWVLQGYVAGFGRGKKSAVFRVNEIMRKLDAVRLRGRKRSMVG
ncbi:kinase-like domain-containing protein [Lipomyces kononenkoae]|uniref:Kinase-like domain-containing protein n=1 Tax=Lipomyces kononenkoae TaxID=34357 RepID=A0ACC3T0R7_LIPKO